MNKTIKVILLGFFVLIFIGQIFFFFMIQERIRAQDQDMSILGASIAIFIADGFSEEGLQSVKDNLEQWQGTVTIAGLANDVTSIEAHNFESDLLISDIGSNVLYDAFFIPGGELASALIADQHVLELLENAHDDGVVIAALGEGTLVQAAANLLAHKKFTTLPSIADNLTQVGGIYVQDVNVVSDENIITACPPHYQELSYAIANAMGYSYTLDVDISFIKEQQGWNYSLTIEPNDKFIVKRMSINLSRVDNGHETVVMTVDLEELNENGIYEGNLGILANGFYNIDVTVENIYGRIELREKVVEFSVGSN